MSGGKAKLSKEEMFEIAGRDVMGRRKYKSVSVRFPPDIHEACKICADRLGMSLSAFVIQAASYRVRNWRDPITGTRVIEPLADRKDSMRWEGWVCHHGSHASMPAIECTHRAKKVHQQEMEHEELHIWGYQDLTKKGKEEEG